VTSSSDKNPNSDAPVPALVSKADPNRPCGPTGTPQEERDVLAGWDGEEKKENGSLEESEENASTH